jgi:hypothetical protein
MSNMRNEIKNIVNTIESFDELEAKCINEANDWIKSGV